MADTPIVHTAHGAFCAACQSLLSIEEEDFGVCDACGGDGLGCEDEDDDDDGYSVTRSNPFGEKD